MVWPSASVTYAFFQSERRPGVFWPPLFLPFTFRVLTSSTLTLKSFSTLDGHGIKLLARAGIEPIVISGRDSPALRYRVAELGIAHAACGVAHKLPAAERMLAALGIGWDAVAAMGDDWPDLPLLARAAFACAPPDAHAEVRAIAHHVTRAPAGQGAVRECCDLLLIAAGRYAGLLDAGLGTLDAAP